MMTFKFKTTLLSFFIFLSFVTGLQAQDKYEYTIINYVPRLRLMEISINGKVYKRPDIPKDKVLGDGDANAALEEINKMADEGWELFDTENTTFSSTNGPLFFSFTFYLRKKK